MSLAENKELVRQFVEAAETRGDPRAADDYLTADFVDHSPLPGFTPDREGVRKLFAALREAFPDLGADIHEQFAEGDWVVTRKTLRGTHRGPFLGVPPSGRVVSIPVIDFLRVINRRIAEHRCMADLSDLMARS